jgi:hypothetical protein
MEPFSLVWALILYIQPPNNAPVQTKELSMFNEEFECVVMREKVLEGLKIVDPIAVGCVGTKVKPGFRLPEA